MSGAANETKGRVIAAASALFAERGFHGTTARDIARRATVNVAAGHYHFGSKEALYLEVLRAQFADMTATLEARGARPRTRRPPAADRSRPADHRRIHQVPGPAAALTRHGALPAASP